MKDPITITHPEIAKQWHPTKNGILKPEDVTSGSHRIVYWLLPYDDPITGKHFDFEWLARVKDRTLKNSTCPYLCNKDVWPGYNDLETICPEIAKEFDCDKNYPLEPSMIVAGSCQKVWWKVEEIDPVTGKPIIYSWLAVVRDRVRRKTYCTELSHRKKGLSKPVRAINDILLNNNISFINEHMANCFYKSNCRYDIYLTIGIVIEYDSEIHFEDKAHFGGIDGLQKRIIRDNIKSKYCADNNIPLLRIPYVYKVEKNKQIVEKIILDFIQTKQVPQEIKDFYAQYSFSNYCK